MYNLDRPPENKLWLPPRLSGEWVQSSLQVGNGSNAGLASVNKIYFTPFPEAIATHYKKLIIRLSAGAVGGGLERLGMWQATADKKPGIVVADSQSTLDCSQATNTELISTIDFWSKGNTLYFLGVVGNSTSIGNLYDAINQTIPAALNSPGQSGATFLSRWEASWTFDNSAALPSTPTVTANTGNGAPVIKLEVY